MTTTRASTGHPRPSAGAMVRRIIVYILLFSLVLVAAGGLSGLLGRLIDFGSVLAGDGASGLARSLAFAVIGGPLAVILWQVSWSRLRNPDERAALSWGLYVSSISTIALITGTVALLTAAAAGIDGEWRPAEVATGLVFIGVWAWHAWMARHPGRGPLRFTGVARVLGWVFGLIVAVGGATVALGVLLDEAVSRLAETVTVGDRWWVPVLSGLVWAIGGAVVWWWFVSRAGHGPAAAEPTTVGRVALVIVGIGLSAVLTLGGAGISLYVVLDLLAGQTRPVAETLQPLAPAVAAALIGAVVLAYHRRAVLYAGGRTGEAARLAVSGIALIALASGLGVIVNATLAALAPTLVGSDVRALLFGGISSLVVGAPVWLAVWKPHSRVGEGTAASTGRRIYLIAVFGLSAVVAIITLLVIGYRVFEFVLLTQTGASLIDRVRASVGLLVATGLVAGSHFARWRAGQTLVGSAEGPVVGSSEAPHRRIEEVLILADPGLPELTTLVSERTGARVTLWERSAPSSGVPDAAAIAAALDAVTSAKVLLIVGPGNRIEVIQANAATSANNVAAPPELR